MNKIFTYPLIYRLIYKFGNIPVSLILLLYLPPLIITFKWEYKYIVSGLFLIAAIIFINRYFYVIAKSIAYKIETDDEKLTATQFLGSGKTVNISFDEIDKLSGGIFDGKPRGMMRIENTASNKTIAFFHSIENARILEALILSKVKKELYDAVIDKFTQKKEKVQKLIDKKKK
ncbi:MAG: hypothetical protein KF721_03395 [Ignavibacteriaceae bacterium]|nr:hypothetical protein [Ignavibacteriaceae bacterium]